ncbi:MAG TPA: OmpA family protein, partial [Candidatus Kapabacteria bacterium]
SSSIITLSSGIGILIVQLNSKFIFELHFFRIFFFDFFIRTGMYTYFFRTAILSAFLMVGLALSSKAQSTHSAQNSQLSAPSRPLSAPLSATASAAPEPMPMPMMDYPTSTQTATGHMYLGADLGITYSWYWGANNFFWPTTVYAINPAENISTNIAFNNLGGGIGGIFGIKGGLPLSHSIDLEGKLRYVSNYTSASGSQQLPINSTPTGTTVVTATNNYSLLLSNLDLAALLHFALTDSWYLAGGLSLSGLLESNFTATQTLPPNNTYRTDANLTPVPSVTQITIPSGSQPWFSGSRFDLQVGAGTILPSISNSFALDAELLVSIPLTSWIASDQQPTFQQFANSMTGRNAVLGINSTVLQPTFPNLWYASLTIGVRIPMGNEPGVATSETTIPSSSDVTLAGTVTDIKTGAPIEANITVVDLSNNEVVTTTETDREGRYSVRVPAPGKYSVTADATDYLFGTAYFQADNQGRLTANHPDIKLSPASGGRTRLLVFFDFNSADLKTSSYPELNRAVRLMKAVPTMRVEIAGYTDNVGTTDYNLDLSKRRANAVRDYLIHNGVDASRVSAAGYGPDSPVGDNTTDEGRAENRRVEFVVLSR